MGIAEDVVGWLDQQKPWLSDAVRRVAGQGTLSEADVIELAGILSRSHGIGDVAVKAVPLTLGDLPHDDDGPAVDVSLVRITDTANVNALDPKQTLEFARVGLTVVYGDNGSGKSSYARLLRQMCHARGTRPPILGNVYDEHSTATGTTARVSYREGAAEETFAWDGLAATPPGLSRVAVFDTNAAHALVEQENEILWKPAGLDLLDRVVPVVTAIRSLLDRQIEALLTPGPLPRVDANTAAAAFIEGLGSVQDPETLDAWAVTDAERARLAELELAIRSSGSVPEIRRLRGLAARLSAFNLRVSALELKLGSTAQATLSADRRRTGELQAAAAGAAATAFGGQAVGGAAWQALWLAASRFAASGGTPDGQHPSHSPEARCVLCRQELSAQARLDLDRFHAFVVDDVAAQARTAEASLTSLETTLRTLRVSEGSDAGLIAEICGEDAVVASLVTRFLDTAEDVRASMTAGKAASEELPILSIDVANLATLLAARAATLQAVEDPEARVTLTQEASELRARASLWDGRQQVRDQILRQNQHQALARAAKEANTAGLSRKSSDLAEKYLSAALLTAYAEESRGLRVDEAVELKPTRTQRGKSQQRVGLRVAAWAAKSKDLPGSVLSEGERRAVALATFLTELRLRTGRSAIVLDDPVSSLDHERQDDVARRLVAEGLNRQVVVFTHSLVFLRSLETIAKEQQVPLAIVQVAREGGRPGVCTAGAPWKAKRFGDQIKWLNNHKQAVASATKTAPDSVEGLLAFGFGRLRQAAERALEEKLLGGCVERYARGVHPTALWKVMALQDADVREYLRLYDRATKWGSIHDGARAENVVAPTPSDFEADVKALADVVDRVTKRQS